MGFMIGQRPFTPKDIATAAWWDAYDEATITDSGGNVTSISDKSGNGNTLNTGAGTPTTGTHTINGKNAIRFVNSPNTYMTAADAPQLRQ